MKFIACLLFLTTLSAFGNNPNTTDQSDAFNSAVFGKEKVNPQQKRQREEAPVERVNKWQEQSRKAQEGERP